MRRVSKWTWLIIGWIVFLWMAAWPPTRAILIFLWPIDPGHEDTVVLVALVVFLVALYLGLWGRAKEKFTK